MIQIFNIFHIFLPAKLMPARGPIQVKKITTTSLEIVWQTPVCDASNCVTSFIVDKYIGESWSRVGEVLSDVTSIKIHNLKENSEYLFRIVAKYNAGLSEPLITTSSIKTVGKNENG